MKTKDKRQFIADEINSLLKAYWVWVEYEVSLQEAGITDEKRKETGHYSSDITWLQWTNCHIKASKMIEEAFKNGDIKIIPNETE